MFLVNWFWNMLGYLGLGGKKGKILFLGLDNAGKTTLLHLLKDDKVVLHEPTRHPQGEELAIGNIRFSAWDLGGHPAARRLWKEYYAKVDAIVYLVDSADFDRFPEAKRELNALLTDDALATVPFLILGNKIDLPRACREEELRQALGIENFTTGKDGKVAEGIRPIEVFMCSVVKKSGFAEGFRWLSNFL